MRYVIKVCYDGTNFCGWQVQQGLRTAQDELNTAVRRAFGERTPVVASGRTDSGVHALGQVCHFDLTKDMPGSKVADALNYYLPEDESVLESAQVEDGFDANRSAKKKTYVYSLYYSPRRNPLKDRYAVRINYAPDIEKMKKCASLFVGEHDFSAYCASGSQVKTTERTVYSFTVEESDGDIKLSVCGNGFLYNMVRTMVGTVLGFAAGKLSEEDVLNSLNFGDRTLVGKTMPPQGLCLYSVDYGRKLFQG